VMEAALAHGPNYRLRFETPPWAERLIRGVVGPMVKRRP
jgi:hypothetical protein